MKTLIAYYSKRGENWFDGKKTFLEKGNCEIVSQYLKEITGGTLFEIKMKHPYSENYDKCCEEAKIDCDRNTRPEIVDFELDMDDFKDIYLVYPIYWSTCPMAVLTFLKRYDLSNKNLYLVSTHEGSGLGASVSMIKEETKAKIINTLPLVGTLSSKTHNRLVRFVEENEVLRQNR